MEENEQTRAAIIEELIAQQNCKPMPVDVIIVVHDQLDYMRKCVDSLYKNTKDFTLYIWDNASKEPTEKYLQSLTERGNVYLHRSDTNMGFILPNNILVGKGKSPYLILLNSDTEVYEGWSEAMVGWLQQNQRCAQVGYLGGLLTHDGYGGNSWCGGLIDYVCGWGLCMSRKTYNEVGLFDSENLVFAYCEDADLSLRLLERGDEIYALHLGLVHHYGNATIREVSNERDVSATFKQNHHYIKSRWSDYLQHRRILAKKPCPSSA